MKNRKRGFSLVELLIVLAVIAALIATITPVALNAIRKSQATKVAQNIKTLASAIENAAYVNGLETVDSVTYIKNGPLNTDYFKDGLDAIEPLGRDIEKSDYGVWYSVGSDGNIKVAVFSVDTVDYASAAEVVTDLTQTSVAGYFTGTTAIKLGAQSEAADITDQIVYLFDFDVY